MDTFLKSLLQFPVSLNSLIHWRSWIIFYNFPLSVFGWLLPGGMNTLNCSLKYGYKSGKGGFIFFFFNTFCALTLFELPWNLSWMAFVLILPRYRPNMPDVCVTFTDTSHFHLSCLILSVALFLPSLSSVMLEFFWHWICDVKMYDVLQILFIIN